MLLMADGRGELEPMPPMARTLTHTIDVKDAWGNTQKAHLSISYYDDGRPCALGIGSFKVGAERDRIYQNWAHTVSRALQHGVPADAIEMPADDELQRKALELLRGAA